MRCPSPPCQWADADLYVTSSRGNLWTRFFSMAPVGAATTPPSSSSSPARSPGWSEFVLEPLLLPASNVRSARAEIRLSVGGQVQRFRVDDLLPEGWDEQPPAAPLVRVLHGVYPATSNSGCESLLFAISSVCVSAGGLWVAAIHRHRRHWKWTVVWMCGVDVRCG